jgi:hypothetical protein
MIQAPFREQAPKTRALTDYDRAHLTDYLRLLDAAAEQANWREVARIIFGLDPIAQPQRARAVYESHLARAQWLSRQGYRDLAWPRSTPS